MNNTQESSTDGIVETPEDIAEARAAFLAGQEQGMRFSEDRQRYDEGYWIGQMIHAQSDDMQQVLYMLDPGRVTQYKYEAEGLQDGCAGKESDYRKAAHYYKGIDFLRSVCSTPEGQQEVAGIMAMLHRTRSSK